MIGTLNGLKTRTCHKKAVFLRLFYGNNLHLKDSNFTKNSNAKNDHMYHIGSTKHLVY